MFLVFALYAHVAFGLSVRSYLPRLCILECYKGSRNSPTHSYPDTLKDIPLFVVESKHSKPIVLTHNHEQIISVFVDPKDANDFLTEVYQAEPTGSNSESKLHIRVTNLQEWLEKVDPSVPKLESKIKFKLVPSSTQLTKAYEYMPLTSRNDLFVPLFYSKSLSVQSSNKLVTPLFLDFDDLLSSINLLNNKNQIDGAIKSIEVMSLVDLLLQNPNIDNYVLVQSASAVRFCDSERDAPNVSPSISE